MANLVSRLPLAALRAALAAPAQCCRSCRQRRASRRVVFIQRRGTQTHSLTRKHICKYIYISIYILTRKTRATLARSLASQQTQSHSAAEFNSNSRARTSMRLCTYGRARATRAHNLRRLARSMSAEVGDSRSRSPHLRASVTGSFELILRSRRPVRQTDRSIDRCERRAGADLRARH